MRRLSLHPPRKVGSSSRRACRHLVPSSSFTYRQFNLYSIFITVFSPNGSCSRSATARLHSHDLTSTIQQDANVFPILPQFIAFNRLSASHKSIYEYKMSPNKREYHFYSLVPPSLSCYSDHHPLLKTDWLQTIAGWHWLNGEQGRHWLLT